MQRKNLSNDDIGVLFLLAALIFGIWFRVYPPHSAGFPINDGALFYKMIETVQVNNFRLPAYVEYNQMQIPFAYPPLTFYIAGAIGQWFGIPTIKMVLWMPAIVLCLTLPCVFWLTKHLLKCTLQAGLAALLYSLLPRALTWMIMGGGITRSLGNLFLILATLQIYLLFSEKQTKYIYSAIVFSAAVCLTHPEAALHTMIIGLMLWGVYGRSKIGVRDGLVVGLGTIIVTSPWWITVLLRFGLQPFIAASQTGLSNPYSWLHIFADYSEEPFMTIIGVLAILGVFVQIAKRQYILPLWYFVPFLVEPRNAPNVYIIPVAILGAISLTELVLPGIAKIQTSLIQPENRPLQTRAEKLFAAYILLALLFGMFRFETELIPKHLSSESQAAFQWIKNNTPKDSEFLIITGDVGLFSDYVNEWFPLLAERRSNTTLQGTEWVGQIDFLVKSSLLVSLQYCAANESASPLACIESLSNESGLQYDYILVQKDWKSTDHLILDLSLNKDYQPVYVFESVVIFEHGQ